MSAVLPKPLTDRGWGSHSIRPWHVHETSSIPAILWYSPLGSHSWAVLHMCMPRQHALHTGTALSS